MSIKSVDALKEQSNVSYLHENSFLQRIDEFIKAKRYEKAVNECLQALESLGPNLEVLVKLKQLILENPAWTQELSGKIGDLFFKIGKDKEAKELYENFANTDDYCAMQLEKLNTLEKIRTTDKTFFYHIGDVEIDHNSPISAMQWFHNNYFAAGTHSGQLCVINGDSGAKQTIGVTRNRPVNCLSFIPFSLLANGHGTDPTRFEVWNMTDASKPQLRGVLKSTSGAIFVLKHLKQFSPPHSANLAVSEGSNVTIWNLPLNGTISESLQPIKKFDAGAGWQIAVQIEELANGILGIGLSMSSIGVNIWDTRTATPSKIGYIGSPEMYCLCGLRNGLIATTDKHRYLKIWNHAISTTQPIQTFRVDTTAGSTKIFPSHITQGHVVTNGEPVYQNNRIIQVWDTNLHIPDYGINKPDSSKTQSCYRVTEAVHRLGKAKFIIGAIDTKVDPYSHQYSMQGWLADDGRPVGTVPNANKFFTNLIAGENWVAAGDAYGNVSVWRIY